MGDIWITVKKGFRVAVFAAVPAVLSALAGMPELAVFSPVFAGVLEAFNNWRKHRSE